MLNKDKKLPDNSKKIGVNWIHEPAFNYYIIFKKDLRWLRGVDRSGPDGTFDYYFLSDKESFLIKKLNLKIVKTFDVSNRFLATPVSQGKKQNFILESNPK